MVFICEVIVILILTKNHGTQVGVVGAKEDGGSGALPIDWSKWLDNFLSRLFILLVNLEPSTTT